MNIEYMIGGVLVLLTLVYLACALLWPERF